jgi:phosphatidylinositol alpha-1,6-mannosyltransferase
MKILLVAQNYYPFIGGVETHVRQVAQELAQHHNVSVVAMNFAPSRLPPRLGVLNGSVLAPAYAGYDDGEVTVHSLAPTFFDRIRMLPIAVRTLPIIQRYAYHGLNRFGYPWYRAVHLPRMRELMRGVEVVHSHAGGYLGWVAEEAAREQGIPYVITPYVHPRQWGDGPEDVQYYNRANAVIGLVSSDRDYLESVGVASHRLHVIGVSPDLQPTSDPNGFRDKHGLSIAPLVLYVGRMMPQKGAQGLLEAAEYVWKTCPEARFVFIGPASDAEKAQFSGRDARVQYLGKVSQQEKADALAACDIFCMPSMSEILPTVYLEAWSSGKPVVGGQAHGLPELVEGNAAGIAVSQNPSEISQALLRLLQSPELRSTLGENGRQLVKSKYSVRAVTSALESLYREVITELVGSLV